MGASRVCAGSATTRLLAWLVAICFVALGISSSGETFTQQTGSDGRVVFLHPGTHASVRINEILAGNRNGLKDEDGDASDWIELHNEGTESVDLGGWSLTDDPRHPDQWVFPPRVLPPGGYLVVFASGKDRRPTAPSPLHTNFKLGLEGEYLGLFDDSSPRRLASGFEPAFPQQRTDFSYGLNQSAEFRYFQSPTPGAANGTSAISEIVREPTFSTGRGIFTDAFDLVMNSSTPGAVIRYTLDGSEPGLASLVFAGPSLRVAGTTTLRAAAFKDGALPSRPVTHTYVFPAEVIRQPKSPAGFPATWGTAPNFPDNVVPAHYEMHQDLINHPDYAADAEASIGALPALSIVMNVDDMFGASNGIYTHSRENVNLFRGLAWERAASVELIPNSTERGFQVQCGIRIHGNASREPGKNPKHSFRLYFRGDYGAGKLQEQVFPDSPVKSFNQLVLRGDFNNSWLHWAEAQRTRGTRIRDGWAKETWRDMGHVGSHSRYVNLFINGLFWGVYDIGERLDAEFAASYLGGEREDYDAMASKPTKAVDGDRVAYDAMLQAIGSADMSLPQSYQMAGRHLDLTNFIDYMLLNFYGGNEDWGFDSNWNAIRRRNPAGLFRYIPWDCEQLLTSPTYNRVANPNVPSGLHTKLLQSPEYRLAFADRVHKHLFNGGALSVDPNRERWLKHASILERAIIAESARWGNYRRDIHRSSGGPYEWYTPKTHWKPEIDRVADSYFPQRAPIFLQQLRAAGLYPSVEAAQISRFGGVREGTPVTISAAAGTIYYTLDGEDPKAFGSSSPAGTASLYSGPIVIGESVTLRARVLQNGEWSVLTEALLKVTAPPAFPLAEGSYYFGEWNAQEPAGAYPQSMMFYQTDLPDPVLNVAMHEPWPLSYNLSSRSRINGLGKDGFGFINTSSVQDGGGGGYVGAAVVALDTTGIDNIQVNWTAGTVVPNPRRYAIRLQYRIGDEGVFADLADDAGSPVEYVANAQAGHSQPVGPVVLPAAANNQPLVELRWKYYHVSGDSGARAQLRVGAILVSSGAPAASALAAAGVPEGAQAGSALGKVVVHVEAAPGIVAANYHGVVTVNIEGVPDVLSGTLSRAAVKGVAVFDDLVLRDIGVHSLVFSAEMVPGSISKAVRVIDLAEEVMPRFIQGIQPVNEERVPFAYRVSLHGLKPNSVYRYANRVVTSGDFADSDGAGNMTFVRTDGTGYVRSTNSPRFRAEDLHLRHGEILTDSGGSCSSWFITEPSGNIRFEQGGEVFVRLLLNDGSGGETVVHSVTAPSTVRVLGFGSTSSHGSALYGESSANPGDFILLYGPPDSGTRPLAATPVEATGAEVDDRYAGFYVDQVAGRTGCWGVIFPNSIASGVHRIEERRAAGGELLHVVQGPFRPTFDMNGGGAVGISMPAAGANGFEQWQARQFSLLQLADVGVSGPDAPADEFGIPNLLRYALDLNVGDPPGPALPTFRLKTIGSKVHLAFRHRQLGGDHGLEYHVELSDDLVDWVDGSSVMDIPEVEAGGPGQPDHAEWLLPIDATSATKYMRLRVDMERVSP